MKTKTMRMKTCSAFPYFLSGMYYRPGHDVKLATPIFAPPLGVSDPFTKDKKNPPKSKNSLDNVGG